MADPASATDPAAQGPHAPDVAMPVVATKRPAAQGVQLAAPAPAENVPARQLPQLADVVAPVEARNCPTAQPAQLAAPDTVEYVPAAQLAHAAAPPAANRPAGHGPQASVVAPVAAW